MTMKVKKKNPAFQYMFYNYGTKKNREYLKKKKRMLKKREEEEKAKKKEIANKD